MALSRRDLIKWIGYSSTGLSGAGFAQDGSAQAMYGLIGKIVAVEGKRAELADILVEGITGMPGCLSYIVAEDNEDSNSLWVTEVWRDKNSHADSLRLPSVIEAIDKGRPLIAGFGERIETNPLGGQGLV